MFTTIAILVLLIIALMVGTTIAHRNTPEEEKDEEVVLADTDCCGAHEVCDKESLLTSEIQAEYYDDEELDVLKGIPAEGLTSEQVEMLFDVFYTLKESDVAGWIRSIQTRQINLPNAIKEEALLIVGERRNLALQANI